MRWLRYTLFGKQRCGCRQYRLGKGTAMELGGVKHVAGGQCFFCDAYGEPL